MNDKVRYLKYVNFTSPTKEESEDAWIINQQAAIYGVLDGATPLHPFQDEQGHNGAFLAAQLFKQHFENLSKQDSLMEATVAANHELYREMISSQVDVNNSYERWSTCIAAIKIGENYIDYVQLGDSMIIVGKQDDTIEVITKDTVKGINERAKENRRREREKGVDLPDESYYEKVIERLRYNRSMANIENGYTVANGMKEVEDYIQKGQISMQKVRDILIFSDGLFHPELELEETYQRIHEIGLEPYIEELTKHQEEKSHHIDDRTAVWLHL